MSFVHLHCRSAYSLFEGTTMPQALIAQARKLHMPALALTDRANLYGAISFYLHAIKAGIKPIIGMEVDLTDGSSLVLLARNMDGYRNLCHLSSVLRLNAPPEAFSPAGFDLDEDDEEILPWDVGVWGVPTFGFTPRPQKLSKLRASAQPYSTLPYTAHRVQGLRLPREMILSGRHARGLIALSGGPRGLVNSLVAQGKMQQAARAAGMLLSAFGEGNFFIEITPHDKPHVPALASMAADLNIPILASNDVLYLQPEDTQIAQALAKARDRETQREELVESGLLSSSQASTLEGRALLPAEEMAALFEGHPQAIANTSYIADQCNLELPLHKPIFPSVDLRPGEDAYSRLWKLCFAGATRHYKPLNDAVLTRLKHELEIIEQLGFSPYFLVVHDITRFARRQGIPVIARGSAANSLVAYVLDITQVDPLANGLLFERFLNPSRAKFELPDIDLDLCWRRRDEVLHYIYRKYGQEHVATVGTYITFRMRSAWREMAKALGISPDRINYIANRLPHIVDDNSGDPANPEDLEEEARHPSGADIPASEFRLQDEKERRAFDFAKAIVGVPRHMGMHCAGVVISPQSTPLVDMVPLQRAARDPTMAITQYDKDTIEDMKMVKMDLLGSRALTTLVDALHTSGLARGDVNGNSNLEAAFAQIPFDDERTYSMMAQGDTLGCFQTESPGMRALLKWLRPRSLNDVAVAISLFRPGPLEGGFLEVFMRRHLRQEAVAYHYPAMEPILRDTHGVILYQEQFLLLAHKLAGLSLGEAEKLRKDLAKTHTPEERAQLGVQFVSGAIERGIDQLQAEKVWQIIAGYSGFGFCKAHACSYALVAYRSAYMKAHYPAHFLASHLNNGGGYYGPSVYVEDARRLGITLLIPHVNHSNALCEVVTPPSGMTNYQLPITNNNQGEGTISNSSLVIRNSAQWAVGSGRRGRAIRFGLQFIKGLSLQTISLILAERRANGPFQSLQELLMRVEMSPGEAASLVKSGACDHLESESVPTYRLPGPGDTRAPHLPYSPYPAIVRPLNRKQMMALLPTLITARKPRTSRNATFSTHNSQSESKLPDTIPLQMVLGDMLPGLMILPSPRVLGDDTFHPRVAPMADYTPAEKLRLEQETLGFALSHNPMEFHAQAITEQNVVLCRDLPIHANKTVTVGGAVVAGRRHQTQGGEWMLFMSLQDTTGLIEVVFFPKAYKRSAAILTNNGTGPYLVTGMVQVTGKGRAIGLQPPADLNLNPTDIATLKMHPVIIADNLTSVLPDSMQEVTA